MMKIYDIDNLCLDEKLIFYALCYAIEKDTSSVNDVIEKIKSISSTMTDSLKSIIVYNIEYYIKLYQSGEMPTSNKINDWNDLLKHLTEQ